MTTHDECEWFLRCHKPVAGHVAHPTLGWVPTCLDHMNWVADRNPTKFVPPIAARSAERLAAQQFDAMYDEEGT